MSTRDQRLINECRDGRIEAFGELIEPYQDRLYNTLFRIVGSREDAAELLQEALIRAYRGLSSFQGDASFYTWIYRIAVNVAFTRQRKEGRLRIVSTHGEDGTQRLDVSDNEEAGPVQQMELEERREIVQQTLAAIQKRYRVILILKDIEGMKYEEIAEILEIPIGTVRSRLHRARSEMRELLKPMLERGSL